MKNILFSYSVLAEIVVLTCLFLNSDDDRTTSLQLHVSTSDTISSVDVILKQTNAML